MRVRGFLALVFVNVCVLRGVYIYECVLERTPARVVCAVVVYRALADRDDRDTPRPSRPERADASRPAVSFQRRAARRDAA